MQEFLKSFGIPMTLGELNISEEYFEAMTEHAVASGMLAYAYVPLAKNDVINIFKTCL